MNVIISVITAVYNDEKFIEKAVTSILRQTFRDLEYIVVDDGSTDKTLEILHSIANVDARLKVLSQNNLGPAAARNKALSFAKGKYIALQDSDDVSAPDRLQLQWQQLYELQNESAISCTSYEVISSSDAVITFNNKIYKDINTNILKGRFCVCHPSILVPKEQIMKAGGYNPFYKKTEDYDLILRLIENGARFFKINKPLYQLRIRENSETSMNNGYFAKRVYENHIRRTKKQPENFEEITEDNRKVKNYHFKRLANELFFSENYKGYRTFYRQNFSRLPIRAYFLYFLFSFIPETFKKRIKASLT